MADGKRKTILLVEDEAIVAMAEKLTLEGCGYRVLTVGTGEAAVATVQETPGIDLILMDINLGAGIDGTEAAAAILRDRDLPVVFLSSHMEPDIVARTEKITSYGYVVKDSNSAVLGAAIKMAFKLFEAKVQEQEKERALRDSEAMMRFIVKHDPNAIAVYDRGLRYIAVSDRYLKDYGVREEDIIGRHHYEVFPEMPEKWKQVHRRCLDGAIERSEDDFFERPDGSITYNRWECRPWRRLDGEIGGIITYTEVMTDRKKEAAARAEVESRFRLMFEQSPDGIVVIDPKTARILEFNETAHRQLGYTRQEFEGLAITDIEAAETAEETRRHISQIMKEGRDVFLTRHRARSGQMRDVQVTARFTEIGGRSLYHCLWRDVTDRLRAEAELKESETRLRDILFSMADWVWEVDARGVYTYSSEKGSRILGASRADIIGKTPFDFMLPKEAARVAPIFSALIAAKAPLVDLENWNIARDGKLVCLLTNAVPILDETGGLLGYRGVDRDITERKRVEAALQESEAKYRLLFDSAGDAIFIHDSHGRMLAVNQAACERLGYSPEELTAMTVDQVDSPEEAPQAPQRIAGLMAKGRLDFETVHRAKDGSLIATEVCARRIIWEGRPAVMSICRDVRERKQAQKEIQRQLEDKGVLLKEVHHRIKNNIASIGGLLALHLRSMNNLEAIAALQDALGRVDSMRILYDTLLLGEDYTNLSVKAYAEKLADSVVAMFPDRARLTLKKSIVDFSLEPRRLFPLGIIINELLTNAMKYAFTGRESGTLEVALTVAAGRACLIVQDDGSGLPPGFEIRDSKGFGLMLVQMLCQQLGGSLELTSQNGACFRVEFPL